MLGENLITLRKINQYSQEYVAGQIGVSRQALAKWENGDSVPDVDKCRNLARLYQVSLDDLVNYSEEKEGIPIPPKGKYIFGAVTVGEKGQIVIPKKAREIFHIQAGDTLVVLGDEAQGLALISSEAMVQGMNEMQRLMKNKDEMES